MVGTTVSTLPDGWVLPGYDHIQELGSGAGGHVWLARHRGTGTPVAVKYLVPSLHASSDFREAYRSEAQLLAALDSPHITRLYEYVEGPPGAAIVMEAVEGCSLRSILEQEQEAATPEAALCILKGSLLGLAAAHEAGVVHRDYKPANVLVTPTGVSKLVDFGIAARTGDRAAAGGTPLYMAPEQFHGAPASPEADVYAATVTFFECVTGERPFPGANAVELMAQHTLGTIPDALAPQPVRPLIRAGMAKAPQHRPPSAREFLAELEAVAGDAYGEDWEERGQQRLATIAALLPLLLLEGTPQAAQASTTSVATTILGSGGRTGRPRPRFKVRHLRRASLAGSIAALLVLIAVAVAATHHSPTPPTANASNASPASLVGATTQVTPSVAAAAASAAAASLTPSTSGTPTSSPSKSAVQSTTPTALKTSSSPTSSASTTATTTSSATATASTSPAIDSLTALRATCVAGTQTVDASVDVTSNGLSGTVTFHWYDETVTGSQVPLGTTTAALKQGATTQTVSASSGSDFANADSSTWYVSVTSSPAVASGSYPSPASVSSCVS